jgi:hypothetical protein
MNRALRFYDAHPAALTFGVAALLLLLVWSPVFLGLLIAPYDYQTADYPGYVDAVRAAKFSPFCLYNPFNEGGTLTGNLIAYFDPIEWLPALSPALPGYGTLQALFLGHLLAIPAGLLLVARANGVPQRRWMLIAPISLIAYAVGPTLKYFQQLNAVVAVSLIVLALGALEQFRRDGKPAFAIVAGLSFAYATGHWIYATVFVPILLAAYCLAHPRGMFGTPRRAAALAGGALVAVVVALPSLALDVKYDRIIEASHLLEHQIIELLLPQDLFAMLGAPAASLTLVVLPAGLLVLAAFGLRSATRIERWAFGAAIVLLVAYSFGDVTPFGPLFRTLYPLAGVIRRPYAAWYVLVPLVFFLAVRGLRAPSAATARAVAALCALALVGGVATGGNLAASVVAALAVIAILVRPTYGTLVLAAVVQWAAVDVVPFWQSTWKPVPIPVALRYLNPYEGVRQYLPFETAESRNAYRVGNIGVQAEFGPSSGAWKIYGTAATYNTSIPQNLNALLGPAPLHAARLGPFLAAHPQYFASPGWERLAVRYYIVGPTVIDALIPVVHARPNLRLIPAQSYWHVIEDTGAAPFVGALEDGKLVPVDARMTRDSFAFTVPRGASEIRIAALYDSWWRANDGMGHDLSPRVVNDGGQLALDAAALSGQAVRLHFTSRWVVLAIAASLGLQMLLLVLLAARGVRWVFARYGALPEPSTT